MRDNVAVMERHVKDLEAAVTSAADDLGRVASAKSGSTPVSEPGVVADTGAAVSDGGVDSDIACKEAALKSKQQALDMARTDLEAVRTKLRNLGTGAVALL